jgi:5-methylcytosine-specific restriction endonuclease McrA
MFDMDNLQVLCEDCNLSKSDTWDGRKNLNDFFDADIGEEMAKDLSQDKRTKTTNEV